ncbi:hypothetical protein GCM10025868_40280 [Angustibacter aerolatus]|uniref:PurM-like C-terminal domain-containing protein n=1 Tax=Angustibacter aerolatus TaxID=1162965 RepID=A0ABQ6JL98_9ACTN|nr:AIR synthase-related protein [Angustibacter aerolatus]GMA88778.1 hypothetical protein GCM10025868_40280 [Angustibacter aerolatus]
MTALGDLQGRSPVLRSGARPGDVLAVAGVLGPSAAGLALLLSGRPDVAPELVDAHRRPRPPYAAGPIAALHGATAMLDVSDGLLRDAGRIARASGVVLDLDPVLLAPLTEPLVLAAAALGVDPLDWVLTGGEDHALLAAFSAGPPPASCRSAGSSRRTSGAARAGRRRRSHVAARLGPLRRLGSRSDPWWRGVPPCRSVWRRVPPCRAWVVRGAPVPFGVAQGAPVPSLGGAGCPRAEPGWCGVPPRRAWVAQGAPVPDSVAQGAPVPDSVVRGAPAPS